MNQRTNYPITQTKRRLQRRVVLNLGHLDFEIVSDFDIRISDFASLGIFTTVKNPLQISSFMQNKANLLDAQMNVNSILTKDYRKNDAFAVPENKANSNPIKANLLDAQMNVSIFSQMAYENKHNWTLSESKPNQTQSRNNSNRYFAGRSSGWHGGFTIDDLRLWGEIGTFESLWLFLVLKSAKSVVNN